MIDTNPPVGNVDLDAIEALADAATAGPWTTGEDGLVWPPHMGDPVSGSAWLPDSRFIAASRTAVPALVAEVRRLRAELERHVIEFRPDGWTIHHPLSCRPDLFGCPVNRAGVELAVSPAPPGRYECEANDLGDRLLILDRIDLPEAPDA